MAAIMGPTVLVNRHSLSYVPSQTENWDFDVFVKEFNVIIKELDEEHIVFDLVNIDCTFANAIRRILTAEVPSVAIERVYLTQNTSIMADETFCHRLGLVPLNVDPERLAFCSSALPDTDAIEGFDPACHLVFDLQVKGERIVTEGTSDTQKSVSSKYTQLYSKSISWVPLPGQREHFRECGDAMPAPISDDILLNKLAPGDEIIARCVAVKGVGRDHAKFSPVSAAFYKLLPFIELRGPVRGELAEKLQKSFPRGVIEIDPETRLASVVDSRLDNGSREHFRHPELAELVQVSLNPNYFIFTVETVAKVFRPAESLVREALDVMISKCSHYLTIVQKPGFAATPLKDPIAGLVAVSAEGEELTQTKLNGREVGLAALFVSDDLRRATFRFTGEDHTLGASLRYCILKSGTVSLAGYCQPHPLEDCITFEIQCKEGTAAKVLKNGLICLRACFEHIKRKFRSALKKVSKEASSNAKAY